MTKISVVMAVYNGEKYLESAVKSIIDQTYRDFELIIINDGSTDGTKTIVDGIRDDRVKVIHSSKNQGVAKARNLGVDIATGEWIAVQDADDISLPARLEEQLRYITAHPDLITVGSHIDCMSDDSKVPPSLLRSIKNYHNSLVTREELMKQRFRTCPLAHGSCTFLKEAFVAAGKYDPQYVIVQDYDLWMRMFERGPIENIPQILYQYRVHSNSLSRHNQQDFTNELNRISMRYIRKQLFENRKREPVFIVIGPKANCDNFKENIVLQDHYQVYQYVCHNVSASLSSVVDLYDKNKIDSVVVLDTCEGNGCWKTLEYLENEGMTYNKQLFSLYNVIS